MAAASATAGLVDTDILIDATRNVAEAVSLLVAQQAAQGLNISVISAMELIAGCRNKAELEQVRQFLQPVKVWPVSRAVSQSARQLMESFFLSHGLQIPDALIAATALEQGLTLYTKNVRHFQMISGLNVRRPY